MKKKIIIAVSLLTYLLISGIVGGTYLVIGNGVSIDVLTAYGQPSFYLQAFLGGVVMGLLVLLTLACVSAVFIAPVLLRKALNRKKNPWKTPVVATVPVDATTKASV